MKEQLLQNSEWSRGGIHRIGYNKADITFGGYHNHFRNFYAAENMKLSKEDRKRLRIKDRYAAPILAGDILAKIGEYMVNHRSGVYMKGMGYFFVYKNPVFWNTATVRRGRPLRHMPVFIPTVNDEAFWGWSMDFAFHVNVKRGIRERLSAGQRYLNMYPALNSDKSPFTMGWKFVDPQTTRMRSKEKMVTKDENGNYIIDIEGFLKRGEYINRKPYKRR